MYKDVSHVTLITCKNVASHTPKKFLRKIIFEIRLTLKMNVFLPVKSVLKVGISKTGSPVKSININKIPVAHSDVLRPPSTALTFS